jgi:hypothetical protein
METNGSLGGQVSSAGAIQGNSVLMGATGKATDRPTVAVGMRIAEDKDPGQRSVLFFRHGSLPAETVEKTREIRRLLNLPLVTIPA